MGGTFTVRAGDGGMWAPGRMGRERLEGDHKIRGILSDFLLKETSNINANSSDRVWWWDLGATSLGCGGEGLDLRGQLTAAPPLLPGKAGTPLSAVG